MATKLNGTGRKHAQQLIKDGKVNTTSSWSFNAADGDKLLGENENWENYGQFHLAIDPEATNDTKGYWKYPYGKDGQVYRSGLIAVRQRAGQQKENEIFEAAGVLLDLIEEGNMDKSKSRFTQLIDEITKAVAKVMGIQEMEEEKETVEKAIFFEPPDYILDILKTAIEEAQKLEEKIPALFWAKEVVDGRLIYKEDVSHILEWYKNGDSESLEARLYGPQSWYKELEKQLNDAKNDLSGFTVIKQVDGEARWFGWTTNKWLDREGEILTDAAHVEFINYLDKNPQEAPQLWVWHTPGTARKNRADWWEYKNGFFMYSGLLTPEEAQLYEEASPIPTGMSHGFHVWEKSGRYITKYRTFEVSELPHDVAANPYTHFLIKEESKKKMFSQRKRQYLEERLGTDTVEQLETNTEAKEKVLEDLGVSWKQLNEEYETQIEKELAERVAKASTEKVESITQAVVKQVVDALNVEELQETLVTLAKEIQTNTESLGRLDQLEEIVTHLKETEDSRIAEALAPAKPFDWGLSVKRREGVAKDELKEEDQDLVDEAETKKLDWLNGFGLMGKGD